MNWIKEKGTNTKLPDFQKYIYIFSQHELNLSFLHLSIYWADQCSLAMK